MAVEFQEQGDGKVLVVCARGKLSRKDYERFVPAVERLIGRHGTIRILFDMHDFHGWTVGALWQDLKFGLKHFLHVARLAMVGETAWQHGMTVFCKPFTTAKVRYFERGQTDEAEAWVQADLPAAQGTP